MRLTKVGQVREDLYEFCKKFIEEQEINCEEDIHQTDHIIENAYGFIEGVCGIVGYKKFEDE